MKKVTTGGEGRWDYFEVDQAANRIFTPRGTHVMATDSEGKLVVDIKGLQGTHGIVFAAELKRAFTTIGYRTSGTP